MSGLAAIFHIDGKPVDELLLWGMLRAAPYRGPDGMQVGVAGEVGLGHLQMTMTPEEVGELQPLVSRRTGCMIVADARLDNRGELMGMLAGRLASNMSDTELILRCYEEWGLEAPARLLGDFAWVLWDPRTHRLVGARDTSGQRTLYYRCDGRTFAAASEIHQLLQDPSVPVEPDEERIRDFLVPLNLYQNEKQRAETFYRGIRFLEAGHLLVADRGGVRTHRYLELQPPAEIRYRRPVEYAEHFLEVFSQAVKARLRSVHPIGAMLSGGLDSSSVVCLAQELYRSGEVEHRGFATFSSVFEGLDCDERPFIEDIARKYDLESHYISAGSYAGRLQLEPQGFQPSPNMGISEGRDAILGAASRAGVRAMLTGDTADACVTGSALVFDSLLRRGRVNDFIRRLRAYRRTSSDSLQKIAALYCVGPLLPLDMQKRLEIAYGVRAFGKVDQRVVPRWIPEPLRQHLSQRHLQLWVAQEEGRRYSSPAREDEARLLYPPEVVWYPAPWSLQVWRPFSDRRLHEFLLAVPPEHKFVPHPGTDNWYAGSKILVRNSTRGILPESVRTRTLKTVFRGVWESEIERNWGIYEAAFGPNQRSELASRGYIDQAHFWSRLCELRGGKYGADFAYVMSVLGLETWLRTLRLPRPQLVRLPPPWQERVRAREAEEISSQL